MLISSNQKQLKPKATAKGITLSRTSALIFAAHSISFSCVQLYTDLTHIMAFRTSTYWKSMLSRLGGKCPAFATSTTPKMKPFALPLDLGHLKDTKPGTPPVKGDFLPVYVSLGLIMLSSTLGLYTAMHQLARAPNVRIRKSLRETIPEVVEPELVVDEADKFIKKSWFRKLAHIQDKDEPIVPDHVHCDILVRPLKAETLKDVGVDSKAN